MDTAIIIGDTPAGCEWIARRQAHDTDESFAAKVETMRTRFAALWARHEARTVRVKMSTGAAALLEEAAYSEHYAGMAFGVTWVEGTVGQFLALLDEPALGRTLEDCADEVAQGCNADLTEAQIAFGARQRYRTQCIALTAIARVCP